MTTRRQFTSTCATLALFGTSLPLLASAQTGDLVKVLIGFPPGGSGDIVGRRLAERLREETGSTFIIDNRPGAGGQVAVSAIKAAAPDGNTLLLSPPAPFTVYPFTYKSLPYRPDDALPVSPVSDFAFGFAVGPAVPESVRTLKDFLAWAKAHPEKAMFGSPAAGSTPHLLGSMVAKAAGVEMTHVAYRGDGPGLQDLMGGQVASTVNPITTMLEYHRAGRIRILAVSNPTRLATLPDVPTFTESRLPALELVEWYGLFAPAKLAPAPLGAIGAQLKRVMQTPELQAAARRLEVIPRYEDGAGLTRLLQQDQARWTAQVAATGIQLD